jgi:aminobenzoyl-glutamate utilization protein B
MNMGKEQVINWVDESKELLYDVANKIFDNPELAFREKYASQLQASVLMEAGFRVTLGLKDIPTALIAEYGSGKPILGILGEYDALPKLSQKVSSKCDPVIEGEPGQGCGHNLLGTAGMGAVLAIKKAMDKGQITGTIRYYGCPAEETLAGKPFMVKEGVFADLDACLTWHPGHMNIVWGCRFLSMNSVVFKFHGVAAHAATAPHLGRSALDAVEIMNVGANYLREHIQEKARLHYTTINGGGAPNIVPAEAAVWYYIRVPQREDLEEIYERLTDCARGAAIMTGTKFDIEFLAGCHDVLPNRVLSDILNKNLAKIGGPVFDDDDRKFAKELVAPFTPKQIAQVMKTYFTPPEVLEQTLHEGILKNNDENEIMSGCNDVGDVSWLTPLALFTTSTWPVGTPAHSWQAVAASGSGIGLHAMLFAAKTLAASIYDLFNDTTIIDRAKAEFKHSTRNYEYKSPIPDGVKPTH